MIAQSGTKPRIPEGAGIRYAPRQPLCILSVASASVYVHANAAVATDATERQPSFGVEELGIRENVWVAVHAPRLGADDRSRRYLKTHDVKRVLGTWIVLRGYDTFEYGSHCGIHPER